MTRVAPSTAASPALPPGAFAHPQSAKRPWHTSIDMATRRTVLLQILMLLKTKYNKVDAKISYIARRAELALYSQAFSVAEYSNPQTLSRRLHALVVKLHMHNHALREDDAFAVESASLPAVIVDAANTVDASTVSAAAAVSKTVSTRKRRAPWSPVVNARVKRQCLSTAVNGNFISVSAKSTNASLGSSQLFMDGSMDLLRLVASFLDARDVLRWSATCVVANDALPALITRIDVPLQAFATLSPVHRRQFFQRFPRLERFAIRGNATQLQQMDPHTDTLLIRRNVVVRSLVAALEHTSLPKLQSLHIDYAFTEALHDRITQQIAAVLFAPPIRSRDSDSDSASDSRRFPQLQELSLRGNGISDDGVAFLCSELTRKGDDTAISSRQQCVSTVSSLPTEQQKQLRDLHVEHNFIGERGYQQLQDSVAHCAKRSRQPLVVHMHNNLVAERNRSA